MTKVAMKSAPFNFDERLKEIAMSFPEKDPVHKSMKHLVKRLEMAKAARRMWNPLEHSDDENLRWSYLRAIEWASWPAFLSQGVAPIALLFTSWIVVLGAVYGLNILWAVTVRYRFVSVNAAFLGVFVSMLKLVTCPATTVYLLWNGEWLLAFFALGWPLVAAVAQAIPPAQVGVVQKQFMTKLGYTRSEIFR
jgi:hypothetical protein